MAKYYPLIIISLVAFLGGLGFSLLLMKSGRLKVFRGGSNQEPMIDKLTSLFNRRYFDHKMTEEFRRVLRYKRPLSIILLDIDNFKSVNKQLGHKIGDLILEKTAALIKANLRNVDIAVRYGGDQFAIIMAETEGENAMIVAERLRKAYLGILKEYRSEELPLSISLGVAEYPQSAQTSDDLVAASDAALLVAKNEGGNKCSYFDQKKKDLQNELKRIS